MVHPRVTVTDGLNSNYIAIINPDGSLNVNLQPSLPPSTVVQRLSEAIINFSGAGDNIVVAAVASQVIRVYRYFLVVASATNLTFKDGAATILTGPINLAQNEAMVFTLDTAPWYTMSTGNAFVINQSGPVQVSGRCYYTQG